MMRINLLESGIQNIRELAKQYNKAIIYGHIDLDGITSAISAKYYLEHYGIETVEFQKIQYGSMEYAIRKPESADVLPVLVDFSHGKSFMKIHTDHHDSQIKYANTSQQFRHSKSNAETISTIISTTGIFPPEDVRIISMIDSAGFKDENVNPWDMIKSTVKVNKTENAWRNHLNMGMACGKLLLSYKNKPGFLETIVMKSRPSLQSMYLTILGIIKEHIKNGDRGWVSPEQIEQNSQDYYDEQSGRKIEKGTIENIKDMTNGQTLLIGNTVVQFGGGNMRKTGSFDRYTAFRLYPEAKYFIMIWDSIGMMQVSVNPWGEKNTVHLGNIVKDDIFNKKYARLLRAPKYNISLLAIKMLFEKDVNEENEQDAIGFNFEEFSSLFDDFIGNVRMTDKQKYVVKKWMNWKPSDFIPNDDEKHNEEIDRALKVLKQFYIPLPKIVDKLSGGHPAITNLTGFEFLDVQQRLNKMGDKNPYEKADKKGNDKKAKKSSAPKNIYSTTSQKIMKSIAQDVTTELNKGS